MLLERAQARLKCVEHWVHQFRGLARLECVLDPQAAGLDYDAFRMKAYMPSRCGWRASEAWRHSLYDDRYHAKTMRAAAVMHDSRPLA
jgi:hypothetical protein